MYQFHSISRVLVPVPWKYTLTAFLLKFLKHTPQNQGTYTTRMITTPKTCKETSSSFIFFNFFTVSLEESAEKSGKFGWKLQVQHSTTWPPDRLIPSLPRPKAPLLLRRWVPDSPYEVIDVAIMPGRCRWTWHSNQTLISCQIYLGQMHKHQMIKHHGIDVHKWNHLNISWWHIIKSDFLFHLPEISAMQGTEITGCSSDSKVTGTLTETVARADMTTKQGIAGLLSTWCFG